MAELGIDRVPLASNSVAVQFNWIRQGAGLGVVHDFALAGAPHLRKVLEDRIDLVRSFYLVRHADDARLERMTRFATALTEGLRQEIAVQEGRSQEA